MITSILRKPHTDAEGTEDGAEARMRQALGKLGTAKSGKLEAPRRTTYQATPGAGRHRFQQDGDVSVVRLSMGDGGRGKKRQSQGHANRLEIGTGHGQEGRGSDQGSADSTRQVQELTEQLRATQTRLGHAELVASEATSAAHVRQEEAAGLRLALNAAEAALAQVHRELAASKRACEELEQRRVMTGPSSPVSHDREPAPTRGRVGRPLGSTNRVRDQALGNEPEPVKWWAGD